MPSDDSQNTLLAGPDIGVLFVHGIGQQVQGETVTKFADALSSWFTRWLTANKEAEAAVGPEPDPNVCVRICDTHLEPEDGSPAHTVMVFQKALDEGLTSPVEWLLAESWWADTFKAPKTQAVLIWMLTILPYMVLEQFAAPLQRSLRLWRVRQAWWREALTFFRLLGSITVFALSLPIAGIAAIFILALMFPFLIPVKSLRDSAKAVALKLANTVGDSFVLISSSTQFDVMVTRVANDLQWLVGRVGGKPVAIVAHSQGTAITYEALRRHGQPKGIKLLVTHGEGIEKLVATRVLRSERRYFRYIVAWFGVASFYLSAIFIPRAAVEGASFGTSHTAYFVTYIVFASIGLAGLIAVSLYFGLLQSRTVNECLDAVALPEVPTWVDMYASSDPVPNGPMRSTHDIEKFEVWNQASILTDHVRYLAAPDDFVAGLAWRLVGVDGHVASDDVRKRLLLGRFRRRWRTIWRAVMRGVAVAGALAGILAIGLNGQVTELGGRMPHGLQRFVVDVTKPVTSVVIVGNLSPRFLTGMVVIAAVIVAVFVLLSLAWFRWESQDVNRFFSDGSGGGLGGPAFGFFFAALLLVTGFAVEFVVYGNYPRSGSDLVHHWLWFLALVGPAVAVVLVSRSHLALEAENALRKQFAVQDLLGEGTPETERRPNFLRWLASKREPAGRIIPPVR